MAKVVKTSAALICFCLSGACAAFSQNQPATDPGQTAAKAAAPLTQQQGEDILNELRLIRKALEDLHGGPITSFAKATPAEIVKLTLDPKWFALGSDRAPVTIVEFSDFQCPYCTAFSKDTFPRLKQAYIDTGKVRFVSREFPLEGHPNALSAALAARCAGLQDRYWQMRTLILNGGSDLSAEAFERDARQLALNLPKLKKCMKDGNEAASIQKDKSDGLNIGVTGTPAFLIGKTQNGILAGMRLDGALPFDHFAAAIDSASSSSNGSIKAPSR